MLDILFSTAHSFYIIRAHRKIVGLLLEAPCTHNVLISSKYLTIVPVYLTYNQTSKSFVTRSSYQPGFTVFRRQRNLSEWFDHERR